MFANDSFEVNIPFQFQTETNSIQVQLQELEISRLDTELPDCKITFAISSEEYRRCEEREYLYLDPKTSQTSFPEEFDLEKPFDLEAILRRDLVSALLAGVEDFEEYDRSPARSIVRFLQYLMTENSTSPFLSEASWGITAIRQAIPLPDAPDESGVKMGITTTLGQHLEQTAKDTNIQQQEQKTLALGEEGGIYAVMEAFFQEEELDYQPIPNEGAIVLSIPGEEGEWMCYCEAFEEEEYCRIYSVFPEQTPPERRNEMAEFITRVNPRLTIGNFEMRYESGEVRFRTAIDVEGDRFSIPLMRQLFAGNVITMERHFRAIGLVLNNLVSPKKALLLCYEEEG
ncbi:MAG: YbjN domain-containing protein [Cyanobacteria bacterium SBLK]|nr:YbjN domain-containing protein [Cyanobacteria bacterium SBLK]